MVHIFIKAFAKMNMCDSRGEVLDRGIEIIIEDNMSEVGRKSMEQGKIKCVSKCDVGERRREGWYVFVVAISEGDVGEGRREVR